MSTALNRGLAIVERLTGEAHGLSLTEIASSLSIPPSATHRLLAELVALGYVRQEPADATYMLSLKFAALGLKHVARNDLARLARPTLERLAHASGELVRLSLVDGDQLVWVSALQGARSGLRYDPDAGATVRLSCSASGHAWLAELPEEQALTLVYRQGVGSSRDYGPAAPQSAEEIRSRLEVARRAGYASVCETFEAGTSAMAAAVHADDGTVIGVVSIAGPTVRLGEQRVAELAPLLRESVTELSGLRLPARTVSLTRA